VEGGRGATARDVLAWIRENADEDHREGLLRYNIPIERAEGIAMGDLKRYARRLGRSHALALELWETGRYEARTLAAFIDEPGGVTPAQMDRWAADFDSWAICDTVCFHLFDRTPFAWTKVREWAPREEEFVRRAAYSLIWGLSVHDKEAPDTVFLEGLRIIARGDSDPRPLVKKAVNMALRGVGKRNRGLNAAAVEVAHQLASEKAKDRAWIGRHALRELTSEKVRKRFG
jgi:3-methyladenine DNA glycosylase AlkD